MPKWACELCIHPMRYSWSVCWHFRIPTDCTNTDCEADAIAYGDIAKWYTYNDADSLCLLFSTCDDTPELFCSDCVSGNPACIIEEDLPPLPTTTSTNPTTTTPYPPECEFTGQTLPFPDSCRNIM